MLPDYSLFPLNHNFPCFSPVTYIEIINCIFTHNSSFFHKKHRTFAHNSITFHIIYRTFTHNSTLFSYNIPHFHSQFKIIYILFIRTFAHNSRTFSHINRTFSHNLRTFSHTKSLKSLDFTRFSMGDNIFIAYNIIF